MDHVRPDRMKTSDMEIPRKCQDQDHCAHLAPWKEL